MGAWVFSNQCTGYYKDTDCNDGAPWLATAPPLLEMPSA